MKTTPSYNESTRSFNFKAPLCFSFILNSEETSSFFNEIIHFITDKRNFGRRVFIDVSDITKLTTDALMYLLAIVNNLNKNFSGKYRFSGNSPENPEVRKIFNESGFYDHVKYQGNELITHNSDNVKIVSGLEGDTTIAKQISDFVSQKFDISKIQCRFIYVMMIELMSNTQKHAYNNSTVLCPQWYCYAEYDNIKGIITFTFMDTGDGIPSTVRKNFAERIDFLKIKGECKYVTSALEGKFRTATNLYHRGKGLPKIREFSSSGLIQNMRIITNQADVKVNKSDYDTKKMNIFLRGTLYNWQINKNCIKGV